MATLQRLEQALANADAAGDVDAAKHLAGEIRNHPEYGAPAPKREPTSLGQRVLHGLNDPIIGAGQLADRFLVNPIRQLVDPGASSMEDYVRQRDEEYSAPPGIDWGRGIGNALNPLNYLGGGVGQGGRQAVRVGESVVDKIAKATSKYTGPATVRAAAQGGATQGLLSPTEADQSLADFALSKGKQAAVGGTIGAGAGAVAKAISHVARPAGLPSVGQEVAESYGVKGTLGQTLADEGTLTGRAINKLEELAADTPYLGAPLRNRREAAEAAIKDLPNPFQSGLEHAPMPQAGRSYKPDMRQLAKDIPVTTAEREAAGSLFRQTRLKHTRNLSTPDQPSAAVAHAIEQEMREAAATAENKHVAKLLTRLTDEYAATWRGGLSETERFIVSGHDQTLERAAKEAAKKAAEEGRTPVEKLIRKYARTVAGTVGVGGSTFTAPWTTIATGVGLPLYGSKAAQSYLTGRALPRTQAALVKAIRRAGRSAAVAGQAGSEESP